MANPKIRSTLTDGLVMESLESIAPQSSYKYALNAVNSTERVSNFGLANELSNELVQSFTGKIVGHSYIAEWNKRLIFIANGSASELWLFNHDTYEKEFVVSDSEMSCVWDFAKCEKLYAKFKRFNACEELHAYFSANCVYRVVNITEMLDPVRKVSVRDCEDCDYFDVFRCICGPTLTAAPVMNSGSSSQGGAVAFAVQLVDNDGNETNWFDISNTVHLETENMIPNEPSKTGVRLQIDHLDPRYDTVNIAAIKTSAGVLTVEKLDSVTYSDQGIVYEYFGQKGTPLNIATIITKDKAFLRGQDLIQKDGRMFYYNLKNERNVNYQKYANQIKTDIVEYEVSMEQQLRYNYPSLLRGENYALGIVLKYCDGTYSKAFHIPAGNSTSSATYPTNSQNASLPDVDPAQTVTGGDASGTSTGDTSGQGSANDSTASTGPQSSTYSPIFSSNLDTTDSLERKRNPTTWYDSSGAPTALQDAVGTNISNIDTTPQDIIQMGACHDNLYGCTEAQDALTDDIVDYTGTAGNNTSTLAGLSNDGDPSTVSASPSEIKGSAEELFDKGVKNREYIERKRPVLDFTDVVIPTGSGLFEQRTTNHGKGTESDTFSQSGSGTCNIRSTSTDSGTTRSDAWMDGNGNCITEEIPRTVSIRPTEVYDSELIYPDSKDCDGNYFYPQGNIKHHHIPSCSTLPHFISATNGVVNKHQPENYEYDNTYVRLLGLRFTNITLPSADELPKPLCPNSPYKIVYVKRTEQNKTVYAKGWVSGIFRGNVYGKEYAYPRHGVNSFEHVDRYISDVADPTSRMGQPYDGSSYTFHSPDTDCDQSFLPITHVRPELKLFGSGWRYGLYAKGKDPATDKWNGQRIDQRGARVANNLNHYEGVADNLIDVVGLTYAEANRVVTPFPGMIFPLMNRYRESSIYMRTFSNIPGDETDASFVGDVLDHEAPTACSAPYIALVRDLKGQYGSVTGLKYIDLGLNATPMQAKGVGIIEGICGDVWIGPYSKRRTSYVSNKVGNFYNPPRKPGSDCRERSICEQADDTIFELNGINNYPTKLPKSGDRWDPRNYCGLHTVAGECGENGLSKRPGAAAGDNASLTDFYYPRTLKSLVHCIVEGHVNPNNRETGTGSGAETGQVYYPRLKDLELDSEAPHTHAWEDSFLNRFYCEVEQPSLRQLTLKAAIRTFLNIIIPAMGLTRFDDLEAIVDTGAAMVTFPILAVFWILANNTLFNNRRINEMLGIKTCLRDEEGGDLDENIKQFEDAYSKYSFDYSKVTEEQWYFAPPNNYNTCDCDSCTKGDLFGVGRQTNNEIYHSNKQNLDTDIDAYRNVKINGYNELPAHAGFLKELFLEGQGMYAHTSEGIWAIKFASGSFDVNDIGGSITGVGELIADPILLFEGSEEGFMGTNQPNCSISVGGWGRFFIDDIANKIYRFNGKPEEISAYGMTKFFDKYLPYCDRKDCFDEADEDDVHYALGWDPVLSRLLITKKDDSECASWTLSYTPQGPSGKPAWLSFHSYTPQGYMWNRGQFLSFQDGKIYRHHKPNHFGEFYEETFPFMVETTTSFSDLRCGDLKHINILSEADKFDDHLTGERDIEVFFDKAAIWNSKHGTGLLPTKIISNAKGGTTNDQRTHIVDDYSILQVKRECGSWKITRFADLVKEECINPVHTTVDCDCQVIPDIATDIYDCSTQNVQDYKNRHLWDKYLNYRLVYENSENNVEIKIIGVDTYFQPIDTE